MAVGVAVAVAVAVAVGIPVGDAVGVPVVIAVGVAVADAVGVADAVADADVDGAAIAVGEVLGADVVGAEVIGELTECTPTVWDVQPATAIPPAADAARMPTTTDAMANGRRRCRRPCCRPGRPGAGWETGDSRADVTVLDPSWPAGSSVKRAGDRRGHPALGGRDRARPPRTSDHGRQAAARGPWPGSGRSARGPRQARGPGSPGGRPRGRPAWAPIRCRMALRRSRRRQARHPG